MMSNMKEGQNKPEITKRSSTDQNNNIRSKEPTTFSYSKKLKPNRLSHHISSSFAVFETTSRCRWGDRSNGGRTWNQPSRKTFHTNQKGYEITSETPKQRMFPIVHLHFVNLQNTFGCSCHVDSVLQEGATLCCSGSCPLFSSFYTGLVLGFVQNYMFEVKWWLAAINDSDSLHPAEFDKSEENEWIFHDRWYC